MPSSLPPSSSSSSLSALRLEGTVERVTFHSEQSGYSVLRVQVKGQRDLATVVGVMASIAPGESLEAVGEWVQNQDYGRQFKAQSMRAVPPSTLAGIEKYLGSGMVKGIGPHFAKKLITAFGCEVFDVIEGRPERLQSVEGIGPKRVDRIVSAWQDQKVIRSIMIFLQEHGISTSKAIRIFKTYGNDAVEKVRSNPYRLAQDIVGIGFKSADHIAQRLGIPKDSILRARAGLSYALLERVEEGHCAYPQGELFTLASVLLEMPQERLEEAVALELREKRLVAEEIEGQACLSLASLHLCEEGIARSLIQLRHAPLPWRDPEIERSIPWVEQQIQIELAPLQKEAVRVAVSSKITLITGGPGTGKSTLTRAILKILQALGVRAALCSPTGRAAQRLSECTGMEAKTIHRTLGFDPKKGGFAFDRDRQLPIDLLLMDEASMVDVPLMHALLKAMPSQAALILIGDQDQLPSVGPGSVLKDLLQSGLFPTVRLTEIFRQAAQSQIVQAAHQIQSGKVPPLQHQQGADFYFIESDAPQNTASKILELVKNRIPQKFNLDPLREVQVLCPMLRGSLGARHLNQALQKVLNPSPSISVERFGYTFAVGDKVMVLQNDASKEIWNGDMGFIRAMDLEEQECLVDLDGREVCFDFGELDILQPAYAVSIHKSQGSEYPAVILPVAMQHYMLLKRNLIYTGITRGKKLVVVVGQKKALALAIQRSEEGERWTNLDQRLKRILEHSENP